MICDQCHERPATVTVTQNQQGDVTERHLCHVCAAENHHIHNLFDQNPFSIHELLSNWLPMQQHPTRNRKTNEQAVCSKCGFSFGKFMKLGKFGCSECYEAFAPQLDEMFRRLHNGHTEHTGKVPVSFGRTLKVKKQIDELRRKMKSSIAEEQFEQAAAFRDQIRELNAQLDAGGEKNGN
ncbi:UvrB/UvrC motif-containing protein [Planococcus lenghuensis]|uniref:Nucleotide excision repair protein n=1 Tax=Planococcus lenghuensis TaxID=2213202 RepID=A0A1Q2KVA9_9BACL|nr:UvrB/UvrC motif-containing protein [Planococcus lenghuensis]AQQ51737.1 nucleotide excision repair protein [Planococcus lenghuensis]